MRRAWAAKHEGDVPADGADPCASSARLVPEHRTRVQAQLSALKRRAAFRQQKLDAEAAAAGTTAAAAAGKGSDGMYSGQSEFMDAAAAAGVSASAT